MQPGNGSSFSLTATPLRFECEALSPLRLDVGGCRAGNFLRGALGAVMRRAYCAGDARDPAHAAACPVCWLLAANERPGQERRGYALQPPLREPAGGCFAPGERFEFGLTLFGEALRFLPYFVLAVPEAGRQGAGAGRGRFALRSVWAVDPLSGRREALLREGEALVRRPSLRVAHADMLAAAERLLGEAQRLRVRVRFLTPMRLIEGEALLKSPDFGVLFARLLHRLDALEGQFGGGARRPLGEVEALQGLADRVRLAAAETRWVEVASGSSRTQRSTWLSGFVGSAVYTAAAETWRPLLPWLLWGQAAQAGKDTVKGNGVVEVNAE